MCVHIRMGVYMCVFSGSCSSLYNDTVHNSKIKKALETDRSSLSNLQLLKSSPFYYLSTPSFQEPRLKSSFLLYHTSLLLAYHAGTTWVQTTRLPVSLQITIISCVDYFNSLITGLLALIFASLQTFLNEAAKMTLLKQMIPSKPSNIIPFQWQGKTTILKTAYRALMMWPFLPLWYHIFLCPQSMLFTSFQHTGLLIVPGTSQAGLLYLQFLFPND